MHIIDITTILININNAPSTHITKDTIIVKKKKINCNIRKSLFVFKTKKLLNIVQYIALYYKREGIINEYTHLVN